MLQLTHYEVLGVDNSAPKKEIRAAYHSMLLLTHPDKTGASHNGHVSIELIKQAYTTLSDDSARLQYDEELRESFKKQGFNVTGAGLDLYTLAEFEVTETGDSAVWRRDCPRCTSEKSIELTESDLEKGTADGSGGYQILAGCQSCSLWITVAYEEE